MITMRVCDEDFKIRFLERLPKCDFVVVFSPNLKENKAVAMMKGKGGLQTVNITWELWPNDRFKRSRMYTVRVLGPCECESLLLRTVFAGLWVIDGDGDD